MIQHCLDGAELYRVIDIILENKEPYDDEEDLAVLLETWKNWDTELICIATSLSQLLEREQKQQHDANKLLQRIYGMSEEFGLSLVIEQIDEKFVNYMLAHVRRSGYTLDEDLSYIRTQLGEYRY